MRRPLIVALALSLCVATLVQPAVAKKPKKPKRVERVAESIYEAPAVGIGVANYGTCLRQTNSCGDIPVGPDERFAVIEIADDSGMPVSFRVGQDTDPATPTVDGDLGQYCGTTEEPIAIEPGYPLVIWPWAIGSADCAGVATTGVITATLSNLP